MTKSIRPEYVTQLQLLYPNPDLTIDDIAVQMGLSKHTVGIYSRMLGLVRPKTGRKDQLLPREIEHLIRQEYPRGDIAALELKTGRSVHAITEWARKRGIVREIDIRRNGDIGKLLSGSLESFYWLGLLAADGYITNTGHLMFSQGEKDKEMVYKFSDYVDSKVYVYSSISGYNKETHKVYRVNICDKVIGKQIRALWGLQDNEQKTYASISSSFIKTKEEAQAFLVGFFDGDGYLTNVNGGKIEIHGSWFDFLSALKVKLGAGMLKSPYLNKRGYAQLNLGVKTMQVLKQFINKNSLPRNSRKWDF